MARASGKDQVAQAELDANYKPSENASYNVRVARQLAGSEKDAFILAQTRRKQIRGHFRAQMAEGLHFAFTAFLSGTAYGA